MFNMPGKIPYVKKAHIKVVPSTDLEIKLNGKVLDHENGLCHFIDANVLETHELSFNKSITELYIEDVWVTHLLSDNVLKFQTPIYRWLIFQVDNK